VRVSDRVDLRENRIVPPAKEIVDQLGRPLRVTPSRVTMDALARRKRRNVGFGM
jgi:hypothetical protein